VAHEALTACHHGRHGHVHGHGPPPQEQLPGKRCAVMPISQRQGLVLTPVRGEQIGPLFFAAWNIQNCGEYSVALLFIGAFCFLRHWLAIYKTRVLLAVPSGPPLPSLPTHL
jgi:hypothetical protein